MTHTSSDAVVTATDRARNAAAFRCAVVIPAVDCPCAQVDAVRGQLGPDDCLVVVWNGSRSGAHDCSASVLDSPVAAWVEFPNRMGAGAARNSGVEWLSGRAEVLAFVDADDVAHENWLAELRTHLARDGVDVAGGVLELHTSDGHRRLVEPGVDFWYRQAVYGSNCAVTRDAWDRLDGFRTHVGTCEDTDLAWRAAELGMRVDIASTAAVRYNLRRGVAEWRQRVTWGRSSVMLLRSHDLALSDHLPTLRGLIAHKREHGLANSAIIAGAAQYAGQSLERARGTRPRRP